MKNKKGNEMNLTVTANFDIKKFLDTMQGFASIFSDYG